MGALQQYRTTPELWAYLFQQFLETGKKSRRFFATSAAFARYGLWPMLVALGCLLIALFSVSERAKLILRAIQFFGVGTLLYFAFVFVRFRSTAARLRALYTFSGHADKLGLQAAIGDDLRAVLQAWIPRNATICKAWKPVACYVVLCALISFKLWSDTDVAKILPLVGDLATQGHQYMLFAPGGLWLVTWIAGLAVFYSWSEITVDRVLLVVDDLDRCEPKQMLEIIESTMLILDDPEIHSRLQVMMLIDESAFRHALLIKYRYLTIDREMGAEHIYNSQRIIRENQEKFFLVHLRLPPLSNDEIGAVAGKFVGQLCGQTEGLESRDVDAVATGNDSALVEDARKGVNRSESQQSADFAIETVDCPIVEYEMRALAGAIEQLAQVKDRDSIGPRTIRCLLFRYQMARSILFKLGHRPDAHHLARAIVRAYLGQNNENAEKDRFVRSAVDQVS